MILSLISSARCNQRSIFGFGLLNMANFVTNITIKSPQSGVTLCFQFVSTTVSVSTAAAMTFASFAPVFFFYMIQFDRYGMEKSNVLLNSRSPIYKLKARKGFYIRRKIHPLTCILPHRYSTTASVLLIWCGVQSIYIHIAHVLLTKRNLCKDIITYFLGNGLSHGNW